jgi:hypothetical protein
MLEYNRGGKGCPICHKIVLFFKGGNNTIQGVADQPRGF